MLKALPSRSLHPSKTLQTAQPVALQPTCRLTYPAKSFPQNSVRSGRTTPAPLSMPKHGERPRMPSHAARVQAQLVDVPQGKNSTGHFSLLPDPVAGPRRPDDVYNVDHLDLWGHPKLLGNLVLYKWFGGVARKAGLYWPNNVELRAQMKFIEHCMQDVRNEIVYPSYALKGFHGYSSNFAADSVAQQATAMALVPAIMTKQDPIEAFAARADKLMQVSERLKARQYGATDTIHKVVDLCCGTGVSTQVVAYNNPGAQVIGVDISWLMLAWAKATTEWPADMFTVSQLEQICLGRNPQELVGRLSWLHDNAENTRLCAGQADRVVVPFAAHELPTEAMCNIMKEAYRILKPGGWLAVVDTDQTQSNLHDGPEIARKLAGLMAREPHLADYLREDLGKLMADSGFTGIDNDPSIAGCTLVMGQKPL
jgi:ubiquinone/menaquinone biosynthesis C-methylase UbiE